MARVFLDTNILIDIVEKRSQLNLEQLDPHDVFLSPLSIHILMYTTKRKTPSSLVSEVSHIFTLIPLDEVTTHVALIGPTDDFEDNVQLQSAQEADCDLFLTQDKKLLAMKSFGNMKIINEIKNT